MTASSGWCKRNNLHLDAGGYEPKMAPAIKNAVPPLVDWTRSCPITKLPLINGIRMAGTMSAARFRPDDLSVELTAEYRAGWRLFGIAS